MSKRSSPVKIKKTIAFLAGGIGDQLYHFTQLRHLANDAPSGAIDLICMHTRPMLEIAACCSWIDKVIDAAPFRHLARPDRFLSACKMLKSEGYDRAAVFHRSTSLKLAAFIAGIPQRIGLSSSLVDNFLLTEPVSLSAGGARRIVWGHRPFIAALDAYFAQTGLDFQGDAPVQPSVTHIKQISACYGSLPRPWTVVNLFVGDKQRRWRPEHAQERIKSFYERFGGTVFLNTGPDALGWHDQFISLWTGPADAVVNLLPDEAPIALMVALYHQADLYLGVDSFTANLALNCNLPAIIMFNKLSDHLTYRSHSYPLSPAPDKTLDSLTEEDFNRAFNHFYRDILKL